MLLLLLAINMCLLSVCVIVNHKTMAIDLLFTETVFLFLSSFVLITAGLYWVGIFTYYKAFIIQAVLVVLCLVFSILKKGVDGILVFSALSDRYPSYIIICFLFVLSWGHFEYFGMGQDEGVYQTEALYLYNNHYDWQFSIDEFDKLKEGDYKAFYYEKVNNTLGFDLTDTVTGSLSSAGMSIEDYSNAGVKYQGGLNGIWHGLPTYAVILGLTAKLLGVENMMLLGALLYLLFLFILELLLRRLGINHWLSAGMILLGGLCPQMIWIRKSSLTEGFLTLLIIWYIYFLCSSDRREQSWAVLPVIAFSFFHVSIYTMMPVFLFNFWWLYIKTHDSRFIRNAIEVSIGFIFGYLFASKINPVYSVLKNYCRPLKLIPSDKMTLVMICAGLAAIIVSVILFYFVKNKDGETLFYDRLLGIIYRGCVILMIGYVIYQLLIEKPTVMQFSQLTIVCYTILSGVFLLPCVLCSLFRGKQEMTTQYVMLANCFVWMVIIYSIFMRPVTQYYYYYSRYLSVFLPVILALFAYLYLRKPIIQDSKETSKRFLTERLLLIMAACGFFVPWSLVIIHDQDDSFVEWGNVKEILELTGPESKVFVDETMMRSMFHAIRSTGAEVYPVMGDLQYTMHEAGISEEDKNLFYLTDRDSVGDVWLRAIYSNDNYHSQDDLSLHDIITGLPKAFTDKGKERIVLYKRIDETDVISAEGDSLVSGWTGKNPSNYRWMMDKHAEVDCMLSKRDYCLVIRQGDTIPFDNIQQDSLTVHVFMNDTYVDDITFSYEKGHSDVLLSIPARYINEGYNLLRFETEDMWSPGEYGSEDKSRYCFSVDEIRFVVGK